MSLTVLFWVLSLLTLVGTTAFAFYRARFIPAPKFVPRDFGEFLHEALTHIAGGVSDVADTAKPHARRMSAYVVLLSKLAHDKFIDRVFGKTTKMPGTTASFFLKYIAEHKEGTKGTPEQKAGLEK